MKWLGHRQFHIFAKSLCAVILAGAICLAFSTHGMDIHAADAVPVADGESPSGTSEVIVNGQAVGIYNYIVTIEFGAFDFQYDWGKWNVETLRYEADSNSADPAKDTPQGAPGWYGFDGTNNRIGIRFNSDIPNAKLAVSLNFAFDEALADGIEIDLYADGAMSGERDAMRFASGGTPLLTMSSEAGVSKTVYYANGAPMNGLNRFVVSASDMSSAEIPSYYLTVRGEPHKSADNTPFFSSATAKLGLLTVRIGLESTT